jgi:hypothetical protein
MGVPAMSEPVRMRRVADAAWLDRASLESEWLQSTWLQSTQLESGRLASAVAQTAWWPRMQPVRGFLRSAWVECST